MSSASGTEDAADGELGIGGDNGSDWWSDLLIQNALSIIHHELKKKKKEHIASVQKAEGDFISGALHPELFRNTDVLLILCIKGLNLKDKEL